MEVDMTRDSTRTVWPYIVGIWLLFILTNWCRSELRKIPGPFLAKWSNLWRFYAVWCNDMHERSLYLHKRHGPLVRIGPDYVSASSTESIHAIYRAGTGFSKTSVYSLLQPQLGGSDLHNLFSTDDKAFHATLKRHLGGLYSRNGVSRSEPNIDKAIELLVNKLNAMTISGSTEIDVSAWMQFWAFDALGEINFSRELGFISKGEDLNDLCAVNHENMKYFGLMGQLQTVERVWSRCKSYFQRAEPNHLFDFVLKTVRERQQHPKQSRDKLDDFLALHAAKSDHFTHRDVIAAAYIGVVTAHDVLAISLRAILYYLAKNPVVLRKFRREIMDADEAGNLSTPVRLAETSDMTYVNAVITECLRIHPSTGLIFERTVPEGGVTLHDIHIPAGTTIGVNAWVFNRDKKVFGEDSEEFRPERWIDRDPDQLQEMNKWLFTFSAGSRSCIGKYLAMMEMTKLVVELHRRFHFELAEPDQEWQVDGSWLTTQGKINMIITRATPTVSA